MENRVPMASDLIKSNLFEYEDFALPSNKTIIKIRPTRTKEEKELKKLARGVPNIEEKLTAYLKLITNAEEIGLDLTTITSGDQLALLIKSRIISKGSINYPVMGSCPQCGKVFTHDIDLTKLQIIYLPDGFQEPISHHFELHEFTMFFNLVRVRDEIALREHYNKIHIAGVKTDLPSPDDDTEGLYARTITKLVKDPTPGNQIGEEVNLPTGEKRKLLTDIDPDSFDDLVKEFNKYYHGFDLRFDFKCVNCGHSDKMEFELGPDFFFLRATKKD